MGARGPRGFALIGLLVVVAIIGILAAIAVPNFLNAQVRAKIARVQADQRNIGTALRMYQIDHNDFPDFELFPLFATRGVPSLTTPVSYMAVYPADVFQLTVEGAGLPADLRETKMAYYNLRITTLTGKARGGTQFGIPEYERGLRWGLRSIGPNRMYDNNNILGGVPGVSTDQYESSNGLVSIGDIWTFGS